MIDDEGNIQDMVKTIPKALEEVPEPLKTKLVSVVRFHQSMFQMYSRIAKTGFLLEKKLNQVEDSMNMNKRNIAIVKEEISSKEKVVEDLWKKVSLYNEREVGLKERDDDLQLEMNILSKLKENDMDTGDEQAVMKRLHAVKEKLARKNNENNKKLSASIADMESLLEKYKALEEEREAINQKNEELLARISKAKSEIEAQDRERQVAEQNFVSLKRDLDETSKRCKEDFLTIEINEQEIQLQTQLLNEESMKADRASKSVSATTLRLQKMKSTLSKQTYDNTIIQAKLETLKKEIEETETSQVQVQEMIDSIENEKNQVRKQKLDLEESSANLEKLRHEKFLLQKEKKNELDVLRRNKESQELWKNELELQKRILDRSLSSNDFEKQRAIIHLHENEKKNIIQKIHSIQKRTEEKRIEMYRVEKEIDAYKKSDGEAKARFLRAEEDRLRASMESEELMQRIRDGKEKKKRNEILRDALRDERDIFSKNCKKTKDQIEVTQKRFKHMFQAISQLKEEIISVDMNILKKQEVILQIKKDEEKWAEHVAQIKEKIKATVSKSEALKQRIKELDEVIHESEKEQEETRKELESVVNDRDILGRRLIQRNDELASLYEKLKLQQSTINQNAVQFRNQVHQIEIMKSRLDSLVETVKHLEPQIGVIDTLKTEVTTLQKQHTRLQLKIRYLYDEVSRPMNIHRWRHLQASDPDLYKKLITTHKYQRQLTKLSDKLNKLEIEISSQEKLYKELESNLNRQPGPEVVTRIATLQSVLKSKRKQLHDAQNDLTKNRNTVQKQTIEIQDLLSKLNDMKKDYFKFRARQESNSFSNQSNIMQSDFDLTEEEYQSYLQENGYLADDDGRDDWNETNEENNAFLPPIHNTTTKV